MARFASVTQSRVEGMVSAMPTKLTGIRVAARMEMAKLSAKTVTATAMLKGWLRRLAMTSRLTAMAGTMATTSPTGRILCQSTRSALTITST